MGRAEKSPSVVVCDAGPLIHLDEVGWLDLLADFATVSQAFSAHGEITG